MSLINLMINTAYAATVTPNNNTTTIEDFVTNVVTSLSYLIGAIAVGGIIYSAYLFMTSGGDPAKVSTARRALLYSIVAVLIVALALPFIDYLIKVVGCMLNSSNCQNI